MPRMLRVPSCWPIAGSLRPGVRERHDQHPYVRFGRVTPMLLARLMCSCGARLYDRRPGWGVRGALSCADASGACTADGARCAVASGDGPGASAGSPGAASAGGAPPGSSWIAHHRMHGSGGRALMPWRGIDGAGCVRGRTTPCQGDAPGNDHRPGVRPERCSVRRRPARRRRGRRDARKNARPGLPLNARGEHHAAAQRATPGQPHQSWMPMNPRERSPHSSNVRMPAALFAALMLQRYPLPRYAVMSASSTTITQTRPTRASCR